MTPFLQFQWRDKCDFLFFSLWFESFECQREGFVVPRHQKGVSSEWYKTWRRTTLRKWNRLQAPRLLRCRWKEEEAERTRPLRYYKFYRGLHDFLFSLHHSSRGRATEHVNNQKGLLFCCCLKAKKSRIQRPTTSRKGCCPSISLERGKRDLLFYLAGSAIRAYKRTK